MSLTDEVRAAIKAGKAIVGFRKSVKYLKLKKPKMLIVAKNIPERMKERIETCGVKMVIYEGDSKKLGRVCGKPYPVSTVTLKE